MTVLLEVCRCMIFLHKDQQYKTSLYLFEMPYMVIKNDCKILVWLFSLSMVTIILFSQNSLTLPLFCCPSRKVKLHCKKHSVKGTEEGSVEFWKTLTLTANRLSHHTHHQQRWCRKGIKTDYQKKMFLFHRIYFLLWNKYGFS